MDVMHKIDAMPALIIGRRDDSGVQTIYFDCSPWSENYPVLSKYRLEMSINGTKFAPLRQSYDNGVLTWTVSEQDTAVAGAGRYEITATGEDGQRKTSASATVYVEDRVPGTALGVPPDYVAPLLDRIAEIIAGAGGGNVTPEQIQQAVDSYLAENPVKVDEQDPTVPDWAKRPKKPTYTAQEVGALPADAEIVDNAARQGVQGNAEAISQLSEDFNDFKENGGAGVAVDATLSQEGQAADAKAVGEKVKALSEETANKVTGVYVEAENVVRNLFNKATVTAESYVGSNGKVSPLATFCASDFIPVLAGETYIRSFTRALSYAAVYDANKAFVAMLNGTQTFTVPDGALYVRITVPNSDVESAMLVKGTNVPDTYIPYDPNGGGESGGVKIADFHNTFTNGAKKDIKEYVLSETVSGAWNGKKVLCIGDSLTRAGTWHEQLEEMLGMSVYKKALGGLALETLFISDGLLDMDGNASALSSADVADKDLVIFFAGTNNRTISDGNGAGTPVYTIGEVGDAWNGSGNKTIAGVVQYAINQIYALLREASNLNCRVMFVTPFYAGKCADRNYDGAHDYNGNGVSLKTIAEMMGKVCAANGVPCYNAFANSGINPNTWAVYTRNTEAETNGVVNDQLHLNMDKGYPHLGKCIAKFVAAN